MENAQSIAGRARNRKIRTVLRWIVGLSLMAILLYTFYYLYQKDREPDLIFKTESPYYTDIYKKTVATGSINPREEVDIKPQVSGVLRELYVVAGQMVKKGDRIGRIQIIPNVIQLNEAENRLKNARLNLQNVERRMKRQQQLFEQQIISESDLDRIELEVDLARQEVRAAENNLELVREGALAGENNANNVVKSTVDGMVLDIPVKEGESVIESNNFNEGTSIVTVADMEDMIFEGTVDEAEVGKIKEGMRLKIKVGALEDERFDGELEFIAPKGSDEGGTIQFDIKASVQLKENTFIRAGYSANAEIVLESRDSVLALKESLLLYEGEQAFVELEVADQQFEKKAIKTGLSDGIQVEIKEGIGPGARVKVQGNAGIVQKEEQ